MWEFPTIMHMIESPLLDDVAAATAVAAIDTTISVAGGVTKLAKIMKLHHSSILGWRKIGRVPAERVAEMSRISGLPKGAFRPDLWPEESA